MADGVQLLLAMRGFFDPINKAIDAYVQARERRMDRDERRALEQRIQDRLDQQLRQQKDYYDAQIEQGKREFTEGTRQFDATQSRQRSQDWINLAFKTADSLRDFSVAGAQVRAAGEQAATSRADRERAEREGPTRQRLLEAQVTGAEAEAAFGTRRNEADLAKTYAEVDRLRSEGDEAGARRKLLRIEQLKGLKDISPAAAAEGVGAIFQAKGGKVQRAGALIGAITPQERRELTDIIADMHADINETYATPGILPEQLREAIQRRVRQAMTLIPTVVADPGAREEALSQMQGAAASAYGDAVPELRSSPSTQPTGAPAAIAPSPSDRPAQTTTPAQAPSGTVGSTPPQARPTRAPGQPAPGRRLRSRTQYLEDLPGALRETVRPMEEGAASAGSWWDRGFGAFENPSSVLNRTPYQPGETVFDLDRRISADRRTASLPPVLTAPWGSPGNQGGALTETTFGMGAPPARPLLPRQPRPGRQAPSPEEQLALLMELLRNP